MLWPHKQVLSMNLRVKIALPFGFRVLSSLPWTLPTFLNYVWPQEHASKAWNYTFIWNVIGHHLNKSHKNIPRVLSIVIGVKGNILSQVLLQFSKVITEEHAFISFCPPVFGARPSELLREGNVEKVGQKEGAGHPSKGATPIALSLFHSCY